MLRIDIVLSEEVGLKKDKRIEDGERKRIIKRKEIEFKVWERFDVWIIKRKDMDSLRVKSRKKEKILKIEIEIIKEGEVIGKIGKVWMSKEGIKRERIDRIDIGKREIRRKGSREEKRKEILEWEGNRVRDKKKNRIIG